jgi:hypothetical protein
MNAVAFPQPLDSHTELDRSDSTNSVTRQHYTHHLPATGSAAAALFSSRPRRRLGSQPVIPPSPFPKTVSEARDGRRI